MDKMDIKKLFEGAPDDATHYGPETLVFHATWYKRVDGEWFGWRANGDTGWDPTPAASRPTRQREMLVRPTEKPAIKTLEDRIKERAIERLQSKVGEVQMRLMGVAREVLNDPSCFEGDTISDAIDQLCKNIVDKMAPHACDKALNKALEELVERIDYEPGMMVTPRS